MLILLFKAKQTRKTANTLTHVLLKAHVREDKVWDIPCNLFHLNKNIIKAVMVPSLLDKKANDNTDNIMPLHNHTSI